MIPTVLLASLLLGVIVGHRGRVVLLAFGLVISLTWGVAVADLGALVRGTLLGAANFSVGALIGLAIRVAAGSAARLSGA